MRLAAGFEQGPDGPGSEDFRIAVVPSAVPEGYRPAETIVWRGKDTFPQLRPVRTPADRCPGGRI